MIVAIHPQLLNFSQRSQMRSWRRSLPQKSRYGHAYSNKEPDADETEKSQEGPHASRLKQIYRRNERPAEEHEHSIIVEKLPAPFVRVAQNPNADYPSQRQTRNQIRSSGLRF